MCVEARSRAIQREKNQGVVCAGFLFAFRCQKATFHEKGERVGKDGGEAKAKQAVSSRIVSIITRHAHLADFAFSF